MRCLRPIALVLVACAAWAACTGDLQPRQQIAQLRVLAMRMDPPEAVVGQQVAAEALIVNPSDEPWTTTWYVCRTPVTLDEFFAGDLDAAAGLCADADQPFGEEIGTGDSVTFEVPEDYLDAVAEMLVSEGIVETTDEAMGFLFFFGWHLRINMVVERVDGTDRIEAHKRLVINAFVATNTNPEPPSVHMQALLEDGFNEYPAEQQEPPSPGECLVPGSSHTTFERGQSYVLTPVNLPEEPETFERPDFTGEFVELTETRWFSWFSTAGPEPGGSVWEEKDPKGLDESVTHADVGSVIFATGTPNDTELLADDEGSPYLPIWVVMRDGRGGVSWCRQDVPYVDVPSDE